MKNVSKVGTLISGAVFGALVAGSAMAADMAVKAPLLKAPAPVYNLTVAGEHEYFAGGFLVHNCDALEGALRLAIEWASAGRGERVAGVIR